MRILFVWHAAADPNNHRLFEEFSSLRGLDVLGIAPPVLDDRLRMWRFGRERAGRNPRTGSSFRIRPLWAVSPLSLGHHFYPGLGPLMARFRPDVVHVVAEAASAVAAECAVVRRIFAPRALLVAHVIQNILVDYRWPWPVVEGKVLRSLDAAVAYSPGAARILARRGFRRPVFIRPFGIDEREMRPRGAPTEVRSALLPRLPVVGWVGRMFAGKGLQVLLKASSLMKRPHQLLVAGDGPMNGRMHALAESLGLGNRVRWMPPRRPGEMSGVYAAMDVYTHPAISRPPDMPAWKEQFARTLPEAMLCGVPVVSTRSGEIPWVVGDTGVLVPERNPAALARALDRMLTSRSLRKACGRRGRERALANFTWRRAAEGLAGIWREIAGQ